MADLLIPGLEREFELVLGMNRDSSVDLACTWNVQASREEMLIPVAAAVIDVFAVII